MIRTLLITIFVSLLGGCGTCVTVTGTYDEVWTATDKAMYEEMLAQSGRKVPPPRHFYGAGTLDGQASEPAFGGTLYFFAEIKPVGSETVKPHKVCVFVKQENIDPVGPEGVTTYRRSDVEKRITASIQHILATTTAPEGDRE